MNAVPSDLIRDTQRLSEEVVRPIPGSQKIFVTGSRDDATSALLSRELRHEPKRNGQTLELVVRLEKEFRRVVAWRTLDLLDDHLGARQRTLCLDALG